MLTPGDLIISDDGVKLVVICPDEDGGLTCTPAGLFARWADTEPWQPTPGVIQQPPQFETSTSREPVGRVADWSLPWVLVLLVDLMASSLQVDCEGGHDPAPCSCDRWTVEIGGLFVSEIPVVEQLVARMSGAVQVLSRRQVLAHELVTVACDITPLRSLFAPAVAA
jgi:hypothetical protein